LRMVSVRLIALPLSLAVIYLILFRIEIHFANYSRLLGHVIAP